MCVKTKCVFEILLTDQEQERRMKELLEKLKRDLKGNEVIQVQLSVEKTH
jgi:hypothetical protein